MNAALMEFSQIPMSPALAATLTRASEAAATFQYAEVTLEHLLLSLCDDPDAAAVLDASRVAIGRLKSDVLGFISETRPPYPPPSQGLAVSADVSRILEAASAAARGGRRRDISGAIVLAAIVGDARSIAAQMLQAQGLTFDEAIRALQRALVTPQMREPQIIVPPAEDVLARARERVQSRAAPGLRQMLSDLPRSPGPPPPLPHPPLIAERRDVVADAYAPDPLPASPDDTPSPMDASRSEPTLRSPEWDGSRLESPQSEIAEVSGDPIGHDSVSAKVDDGGEEPDDADGGHAGERIDAKRDDELPTDDGVSGAAAIAGQDDAISDAANSAADVAGEALLSHPAEPSADVIADRVGEVPMMGDRPSYGEETEFIPRQPSPMLTTPRSAEPQWQMPPASERPRVGATIDPGTSGYHATPIPPAQQPAEDRPAWVDLGPSGEAGSSFPDMQVRAPFEIARPVPVQPPPIPPRPVEQPPLSSRQGDPSLGDFLKRHAARPVDRQADRNAMPSFSGGPALPSFGDQQSAFPQPDRPPGAFEQGGRFPPLSEDDLLGAPLQPGDYAPPSRDRQSATTPTLGQRLDATYTSRSRNGSSMSAPPQMQSPFEPPIGSMDSRLSAPPVDRAPAVDRPSPSLGRGVPAVADRPQQPSVQAGELVENIPRAMRVGISERIEIRIGKTAITTIAQGLEGQGGVWQHGIKITQSMSVRLRAPDGGFFIETVSPETQWIEQRLGLIDDDFASWRFVVTPQERGRAQLQIVVAARTVGGDGIAAETALPDQIIDVRVRTNVRRALSRSLGWAIAAAAGGALARFGEGGFELAHAVVGRIWN